MIQLIPIRVTHWGIGVCVLHCWNWLSEKSDCLQGGMSVDSITDLDDNQSRLLEALQLSLPAETPSKKEKHRDKRLSLNPIYRQVPRVVDSCCQHIEKYGEHYFTTVADIMLVRSFIYQLLQ